MVRCDSKVVRLRGVVGWCSRSVGGLYVLKTRRCRGVMTMTMSLDDGEQGSEHRWLREAWTERHCAEAGIDCDSPITALSKCREKREREREGLHCFTDSQSSTRAS